MMLKLRDLAPGVVCLFSERIGDEIREVYYRREYGDTVHKHCVKARRLGLIQGTGGEFPEARYVRLVTGPRLTEVDGRILVDLDLKHAIWFDRLWPAVYPSWKCRGGVWFDTMA